MTSGTWMPAPPWCCSTRSMKRASRFRLPPMPARPVILYIVNRLTGKLIRKSPPFVDVSDNFMTALGPEAKTVWPANHGGAMWQPPAYSPQTGYFYQLGINEAHDYIVNKPLPEIYKPGTPIRGQYSGGDMPVNNKVFIPNGTFSAIDVATGKIAWQVQE